MQQSGIAEGGDIIISGKTAFLGQSSRTNAVGISQLSEIFRNLGFTIRVASVPSPYLHLGGAMTILAEDLILSVRDILPNDFLNGFRVIKLNPGNFVSGNVISNGKGIVIAEDSNTEAIAKLLHASIHIHAVNLSEFIKGTGGPSCLILPAK